MPPTSPWSPRGARRTRATSRVVLAALLGSSVLACHRAPPTPPVPPPAWAYPVAAEVAARASSPDASAPLHVDGSDLTFTASQVDDPFLTTDWHPAEHAALPPIVARGRPPEVLACGYCHRADGSGSPENASLAGLSPDYVLQQLSDFRRGARRSSVDRAPIALMIQVAKSATRDEIATAAAYFASIPPRADVRVIESDDVPATRPVGFVLMADAAGDAGSAREPLAGRIVEVPEDRAAFEARDAHARYVAYVPRGSLARGRSLSDDGGHGRTMACTSCHGRDLRGLGSAPRLAGRSPSYLFRQLYDLRHGARAGATAMAMMPAVAGLTEADMVDVSAYAASLAP